MPALLSRAFVRGALAWVPILVGAVAPGIFFRPRLRVILHWGAMRLHSGCRTGMMLQWWVVMSCCHVDVRLNMPGNDNGIRRFVLASARQSHSSFIRKGSGQART